MVSAVALGAALPASAGQGVQGVVAACVPQAVRLAGAPAVTHEPATPGGTANPSAAARPTLVFTDVTAQSGIDFVQTIGDRAMTNIVEATGVGCGLLDYDGDGWLDVYLVSGCWTPGLSDAQLDAPERARLAAATDRLYRNLGNGRFVDVTVPAGLARPGYGMGVVSADYDGDGDADLYVTHYGPNLLYRNNGDGTFTEVAEAAGVADPRFSVGAGFFDYDHDGRLDLYVGNYITYRADAGQRSGAESVRSPLAYPGQQDRLYRGNADGTFTDMTQRAGVVVEPVGRAMGVGVFDYDADGWVDVFVSNDAMENFLLHNRGDGRFENEALLAGVAFGEAGDGAAAMAAEIGDIDGDGRVDILVPDMGSSCLYRNLGGGMFEDVAVRSGLSSGLTQLHSWGGVLADLDLDGDVDAFLTNGSAWRLEAQPNRLFVNDGRGRFSAVAWEPGAAFTSRGVSAGDLDNDGDVDLLVANLNASPNILRNDTPRAGRHWLSVQLVGLPPNRDALGAVVRLRYGGRIQVRRRVSGGSYLSQHDGRLHFGLGEHRAVERLEVDWPDGTRQVVSGVPTDGLVVVRQSQRTDERSPKPQSPRGAVSPGK
ncbi:MAG: CRTAC1 family protein [bacterium]|nr:CRTAC1 family protein [bacterium]